MGQSSLSGSYPWTASPLLVSAPMLRIALAPLAVAVSQAGGFGFLAGGFDTSDLDAQLSQASQLLLSSGSSQPKAAEDVMPIGVGFLNWGAKLEESLKVLQKWPVAAAWFYAPYEMEDLQAWTDGVRRVSEGRTKVWVQVGNVELALKAVEVCKPDVIVVQGSDAGGHGLANGAGIITLLPEVLDAFAKRDIDIPVIAGGGVIDGRGFAACLTLGAVGCVLGTRFLVAEEAEVKDGYRKELIRAGDGGPNTIRSTVYDHARGIHDWPKEYNGRGVINRTYQDAVAGMEAAENERLYNDALKRGDEGWGPEGRLCTYAGTGIGLITKVEPAQRIVQEVTADALACVERTAKRFGRGST